MENTKKTLRHRRVFCICSSLAKKLEFVKTYIAELVAG